jgi:hypothetical protein
MAEDSQPLQQQQQTYPSYQTCNSSSSGARQVEEEQYGLGTIRRLLDQSGTDGTNNSFTMSPFHQQSRVRSFAKGSSSLRVSVALLAVFSMVVVVGIHRILPTADEVALAQHYYGRSALNSLPGSTLRIREAQQTADAARRNHLKSVVDASEKEEAPQQRRALRHTRSEFKEEKHLREGCEATVVILRHCEKGTITEHCAYTGYERSVYLASLFGDTSLTRWPSPSYIFAESPGHRHSHKKMNFREIETVGPLALASNVTVDDSYTDNNLSTLSKRLLHQIEAGNMCGKVAVMAWKHSSIAHAAHVLGCGPKQGCPLDYSGKTFDNVWQLKFVYRAWEHSNHKKHFVVLPETPYWKVFGAVREEGFDPLAVSKQFGDYPSGGTRTGGRWQNLETAYPERKHSSDTAGWSMTRVGFPIPDDGDDDDINRKAMYDWAHKGGVKIP